MNDCLHEHRSLWIWQRVLDLRCAFAFALVGLSTFWSVAANAALQSSQPLPESVAAYFRQHCVRCHGASVQKAERRLDLWPDQIAAGDDMATLLEEALDAINRGDMPPKTQGITPPAAAETRALVRALTAYLLDLENADAGATTTLRRLSRYEYVNTLRDLLRLRREFFDFTADFPPDATSEGFDNNGEALILSDYQLKRYLESAQRALAAATWFGVTRPELQHWNYTGSDFNGVSAYERAPVTWRLMKQDGTLEIGHGQPEERHPSFVPAFVKGGGVPADGWYTIRIRAEAANRLDHGYEHDEFERFRSQYLKLALWVAPNQELLSKNAADQRQLVSVHDLSDDGPRDLTVRVWMERGAIPFLSWTNGISSKGNIRRVAEKHHSEVIRATKTQRDAAQLGNKEAADQVAKLDGNSGNAILSDVYHGPRVRVHGMSIDGPQFDEWPPASHQALYGTQMNAAEVDIDQCLQAFASRAYRRPVQSAEVKHYADFVRQQIDAGQNAADAIPLGLAGILTSPKFLYLDEGDDSSDEPHLDAYQFASRLSYFLWSSMPDEELLRAAGAGELSSTGDIRRQVQRMLSDERSGAFVEHFADTWLRISTLGSMPPDPKAFPAYYRDRLEQLFRTETRMFLSDLLQRDGSIQQLLDSDYTFCNEVLAAYYGIAGVQGEAFERVTLLPEHRRGGLLGQGSILTLTANGIETSPVVRGVWVLENILGTPPAPPPPDIEPFEPDTRGTTSLREQLNRHRTVETCADCHQKIDPVGFALEFFDPVGGFRETYPGRTVNALPVDGAGSLPGGETFEDERGLKQILLSRSNQFAETLTEKLLTYATGRSMRFQDRAEIARIAAVCRDSGYGFRELVTLVATSPTLRQK